MVCFEFGSLPQVLSMVYAWFRDEDEGPFMVARVEQRHAKVLVYGESHQMCQARLGIPHPLVYLWRALRQVLMVYKAAEHGGIFAPVPVICPWEDPPKWSRKPPNSASCSLKPPPRGASGDPSPQVDDGLRRLGQGMGQGQRRREGL